MAERMMGHTARLICETLAQTPNMTANQVAESLDKTFEAIKKPLRKLIDEGYVKRGRREKGGFSMCLTGKPYPPSSANARLPDPAFLRASRIEEGFGVLIPAMRAMVESGRISA
ncbi:hypothetical protein DF021_06140 [Burkholderia stagnalis]|uniref:MarR family transcriptional regulator n=1 Tax=Burkholderia stagnalis TaxID=1503054 RepID=A0ABX9YUR8_9BURK|nr:hypothetical protein [Burkholderia stagnalis]RQQ64382.1 hypothetical protein DF158_06140 [Burkholderia stagnalis]RQR15261.1 hypothetical protein DF021_06140 [Burkholderia stagnalis]RQY96452.1 hypothetical protein DF017_07320 [Burkholderia stagnalis]RQZ23218.1 hypothetical protein DF016_01250 [Burkholderia stagnalis]